MAYLVIENFITKEEQKELLSIVENNKRKMTSFEYFNDKVATLNLKSNLSTIVEKHNYLLPI